MLILTEQFKVLKDLVETLKPGLLEKTEHTLYTEDDIFILIGLLKKIITSKSYAVTSKLTINRKIEYSLLTTTRPVTPLNVVTCDSELDALTMFAANIISLRLTEPSSDQYLIDNITKK